MPTAADPPREVVTVGVSALVALLIDPGAAGEAVARRLRAGHLIAPALLPFEVSNVLRRRRNAGLLSHAEAALAFRELEAFPIELWPFAALAPRMWELGENLSSYDAAYVALAEATSSPLVTCDARIASAPGVRCAVEVL